MERAGGTRVGRELPTIWRRSQCQAKLEEFPLSIPRSCSQKCPRRSAFLSTHRSAHKDVHDLGLALIQLLRLHLLSFVKPSLGPRDWQAFAHRMPARTLQAAENQVTAANCSDGVSPADASIQAWPDSGSPSIEASPVRNQEPLWAEQSNL